MRFFTIPNPFGDDFGISPRLTITGAAINVLKREAFRGLLDQPLESEIPVKLTDYGPVVDVVILSVNDNKYIDIYGNEITVQPVELTTCILDVTSPNNIVKTSIQGRPGTIKEYVAAGDKAISGQAIISSDDNTQPSDFIRQIDLLMSAPTALDVSSLFLNDCFNVSKIVIDDYKVTQLEGYRNTVMLSFTASNDLVIDVLDLNELNNPNEVSSEFTYK